MKERLSVLSIYVMLVSGSTLFVDAVFTYQLIGFDPGTYAFSLLWVNKIVPYTMMVMSIYAIVERERLFLPLIAFFCFGTAELSVNTIIEYWGLWRQWNGEIYVKAIVSSVLFLVYYALLIWDCFRVVMDGWKKWIVSRKKRDSSQTDKFVQ